MWKDLFAHKPLSLFHEEMQGENRLHRVLGRWSLTSLGIGCIIGAGIFVLTGLAAHYELLGSGLYFASWQG